MLEGNEAAVGTLFADIKMDPRHEDVSVIESGRAGARVFARWAMARVSADGQPDIPLIAHEDGISPAAGRGTTPDQEAILDTMRRATRIGAAAR